MFLMRSVARRYLHPRAVPIAVGLFALDDWLIYYSAEIKQYCSDTTLTLVALLLRRRPRGHEPAASARALPSSVWWASGFRIRWPWCSPAWGRTWS